MSYIEVKMSIDLDDHRDEVIEYINDKVDFGDLGDETKEEAERWVASEKDIVDLGWRNDAVEFCRDNFEVGEVYSSDTIVQWVLDNCPDEMIEALESALVK